MPEIIMTIRGAVVGEETARAVANLLRPFTISEAEATLSRQRSEDIAQSESPFVIIGSTEYERAAAQKLIDQGGTYSIASFRVTTGDGATTYQWSGDPEAPLDLLNDCQSAHVSFTGGYQRLERGGAMHALNSIDLDIDRWQTRVRVSLARDAHGLRLTPGSGH